jgi:hypothetical protein
MKDGGLILLFRLPFGIHTRRQLEQSSESKNPLTNELMESFDVLEVPDN